MRVLLDTRIAIWWLDASPRLSLDARALVEGATDVFVSQASLWEMAVKQNAGRLRVDLPAFAKHADATGFRWLDVRPEHVFAVARLAVAPEHRNPFERMLVAQSMTEPLILLTPNPALQRYGATVRVV